jgi:hypothetical protein
MNRKIILLFLVIGIFVAMALFYSPSNRWPWDPSYYYAQLRSPLIENDLDFRNETITQGYDTEATVTGLQGSPFPVGPSILWSPFFLLAHLIVIAINPAKATGFSAPYLALVSFGSSLYGLAGLFVVYKTCRYYGGMFISTLAVILTFAATPLIYYIFRQPIMAHTTSFLISTLLYLFYTLLTESRIRRNWSGLIFGVLLGLSVLMRWSTILFIIFPFTFYASRIVQSVKARDSVTLRSLAIQICVAFVFFGLTISPQLTLWKRLYANILVIPQGASFFENSILPINILKVFIDTNRGLLFWCPFLLIGILGSFRIPNKEIRISTVLCVISLIVLIGYHKDWYGGGAFGTRFFIELLPLIAVGFVCLTNRLSIKPRGKAALVFLSSALIIHQSVLIYEVEQGLNSLMDIVKYNLGEPIGLRWQFRAFIRLIQNPGAWFAPRPEIEQRRQAIIVNLLRGVTDFRAYIIPASAAVLTPLALWVGFWVRKYNYKNLLPIILIGVVIYMVGWAVFLLLVG